MQGDATMSVMKPNELACEVRLMFRTGRFRTYPEEIIGYVGEMLEEIDRLQAIIHDYQIKQDKYTLTKEMMLPPNVSVPEEYYSSKESQKVDDWILDQAKREENWTFPVWELRMIESHLQEFTKKEMGSHVTRIVEEKIPIEKFEIMELIDLNSGYSCDQTKSRNKAIDYSALEGEDAKVYQYNMNRTIQEEAIVEFFTKGKGKKILNKLGENTRNKIIANSL